MKSQQLDFFSNNQQNQGGITKRLKRSISKTELRYLFSDGDVPCSWYTFREKFFTEKFISEVLQLTHDEFKRITIFDFHQTKKIYEYFNLDASDL